MLGGSLLQLWEDGFRGIGCEISLGTTARVQIKMMKAVKVEVRIGEQI